MRAERATTQPSSARIVFQAMRADRGTSRRTAGSPGRACRFLSPAGLEGDHVGQRVRHQPASPAVATSAYQNDRMICSWYWLNASA